MHIRKVMAVILCVSLLAASAVMFTACGESYTVTYSAGLGGKITGALVQTVDEGESTSSVTAVPDDGYVFVSWTDGKTSATRRETDVRGDRFLMAIFAVDELYSVTYIPSLGGTIEGQMIQVVNKGGAATTVKAVALPGYNFVSWSDGKIEAERTDKNITANLTVTANFDYLDPDAHSVIYTSSVGGRVEGETYQLVSEGGDATTVKAVADTGYEFVGWSDDVKTAERTDTDISADLTVNANFDPLDRVYAVVYIPGQGGTITGEMLQTVKRGGSATTVTAVASHGYAFVSWSDGVTTPSRTDTEIKSNLSVTAIFESDQPIAFAGGTGTVSDPYQIADAAQLKNMRFYPNDHFKLISDITLSEVGENGFNFKSLFSDENMFQGSLDGNGHKIVNLAIRNEDTFYTGLFACIGKNGSVKDLTLTNAKVAGTNYVGGIAGFTQGTINGCRVEGSLNYIKDNNYKVFVGGVAGRAENDITDNTAKVILRVSDSSGETNVGGIAGYYTYTQKIDFTGNAEVDIDATSDCKLSVGGLIGNANNEFDVKDSSCTGVIKGETGNYGCYFGGLIGYGLRIDWSGCRVACDITVNGRSELYVGGLTGKIWNNCNSITNCEFYGKIDAVGESNLYAGELIGSAAYEKISYSHTNADITVKGNPYIGGLIGEQNYYSKSEISYCYTEGKLNSIAGSSNADSVIGGFVGRSNNLLQMRNSYSTVHILDSESSKKQWGAFVGFTDTFDIADCHWLYYGDSGVNYAIGYGDSMGIPSSIGSIKHESAAEFALVLPSLNNGAETPAWTLDTETGMPVLKVLQNK